MKLIGSRPPIDEDKHGKPLYTMFVVSLILAFVFASLPIGSVFAAPIGGGTGDSTDGQEWEAKVNQLRGEIAFFNNLNNNIGRTANNDSDQARYLDQNRAAMRAAQAVMVKGGSVIPVTGDSANGASANGNGRGGYYARHPEKLLAMYLHQMRQLRMKMNDTERCVGGNQIGGQTNNQALCQNVTPTGGANNGGTGTGTP